jgi:Tfp pilus assembly protein PilN
MIRANLLPRARRTFAALGFEFGSDYLREAMLGIAVVTAVTAAGIGIETLREHRVESTLAEAAAAVANRSTERDASTALALQVSRYQEIAREADADRQSGTSAALAIARIGNAVPAGVWLDSLSHEATGFSLTGSAESLDAVGAAINRLGAASPEGRARLVSIDNRDRSVRFNARLSQPAAEVAR